MAEGQAARGKVETEETGRRQAPEVSTDKRIFDKFLYQVDYLDSSSL